MSNQEIQDSSLRFIFNQLDLYVESNRRANKNNNKGNKNNRTEETKLKVLD